MIKNWWFKFDFKAWRTDPNLRRCSLETRGFWIEVLCVLHETGEYELSGSYEELGWLIGCSPEIVARCAVELQRTKTADVTLGNGNVTLLSRRLKREVNEREQTRLRVRNHRSNTSVTEVKHHRVISKSKNIDKEEEKDSGLPLREVFLGTTKTRLIKLLGLTKSLPAEHDWHKAMMWAFDNGFSSQEFIECAELLQRQTWRSGAITPKTVSTNLPSLASLRAADKKSAPATAPNRPTARQLIAAIEQEAA